MCECILIIRKERKPGCLEKKATTHDIETLVPRPTDVLDSNPCPSVFDRCQGETVCPLSHCATGDRVGAVLTVLVGVFRKTLALY